MVSVLILTGSAQDSNGGTPSYNCSHSYQLSPSTEEERCCVHVSPSLSTGGSCSPLMEILFLHGSMIAVGDCLELMFAPGDYFLPSLSQVLVEYSVVMTAPQGGVHLVCAEEGVCGEGGGGGLEGVQDEEEVVAMIVFNGMQREDMFVEINGIKFSDCTRQLQFDELSSLTISNCTFM